MATLKKDDFLKNGFTIDNDPMFKFKKMLISNEEVDEKGLDEDEIPCLLFGTTGINSGFCVYTGAHFVWIDSYTIDDALEFASRIVSFEPV